MGNVQPFETSEHDLTGRASIDFKDQTDFNNLALRLFANYDPDRFEPIALRFFVQNKKPIITLYALDKSRQERAGTPKDKLPVKKFKVLLPFEEFVSYVRSFDLTVTNGAHDIKDMLVINR